MRATIRITPWLGGRSGILSVHQCGSRLRYRQSPLWSPVQMKSIADGLRQNLEVRGEYVVMANAPSGFFAMFPTTWSDRVEGARRDGREGPNLVVYRTISDDTR